jgi:hypothetical protein
MHVASLRLIQRAVAKEVPWVLMLVGDLRRSEAINPLSQVLVALKEARDPLFQLTRWTGQATWAGRLLLILNVGYGAA